MTARPTVTVTHFHTFYPDAQAEFDALAAEDKRLAVQEAREGPTDQRLSQAHSRRDEIKARQDELRATIGSGAVQITLSGLPRKEYRALVAQHPPRDGNDLDKQLGYNTDTFGEALIAATITTTTTLDGEPVANEWDVWADEMTDGQWHEMFTAALNLNRTGNPVFPR